MANQKRNWEIGLRNPVLGAHVNGVTAASKEKKVPLDHVAGPSGVPGYWMMPPGYWMMSPGYWMMPPGYWM